jgi:hypothetical protein
MPTTLKSRWRVVRLRRMCVGSGTRPVAVSNSIVAGSGSVSMSGVHAAQTVKNAQAKRARTSPNAIPDEAP